MVAKTHEDRVSFSKKTPALQLGWDATSLQSFMTCPRRYQYEILEGWRRGGAQHHLEFGTIFHASLEEYDKARCRGLGKDEASAIALDYALNQTWNEEAGAPWDSGDNKKNRHTLVRAVVWYCDEQAEEGGIQPYAFPDGTPGVELSFRLPLPLTSKDGEGFLMCGHMDGIAKFGDEVFVRERKTTGTTLGTYYFQSYAPNVQVDTYDLVASTLFTELKISGVILEATQAAVGFSRFHRQPFYHNDAQREEWLGEMLDVIAEAEKCARNNYWPRRTAVCNMYGGCPFRSVCALAPSQRDMMLRKSGDYVQSFWDPLESR